MRTCARGTGSVGVIALLLCISGCSAARWGSLTVSGDIHVPQRNPCLAAAPNPVIVVREATSKQIEGSYAVCDSRAVRQDSSCWLKPTNCPATVAFVGLPAGRYQISIEMCDSVWRSSNGERGTSKVLGYYAAPTVPEDSSRNVSDPARAAIVVIDEKHKWHDVILNIW